MKKLKTKPADNPAERKMLLRFVEFLKDQKITKPVNFISSPSVSVIMPTYCRAHDGLLARSLKCVLTQSFGDLEFIILDDGSADGSEDVVRDFQKQDNRILYVRHELNSGLPALRVDEGILLSRGKYLAFAFDDDEWFPSFLRRVTREAENRRSSFVYCQAEYLLEGSKYSAAFPRVQPTYKSLAHCNRLANASVLIRRSMLETAGLYNPHVILRRFCDWDLWLRIARIEAPRFIPEVLVRVNGNLPDSIGIQVHSFTPRDWAQMMGLFDGESLAPKNILDFELMSLEKYTEKLPRWRIARLYKYSVLPWLKLRIDPFQQYGISTADFVAIKSLINNYDLFIKLFNFVTGFNNRTSNIIRRLFSPYTASLKYLKQYGPRRFIAAAVKHLLK